MGRALFSHRAAPAPAVRTESERVLVDSCHKWSVSNQFDPDSDEFFVDAQYEVVLDPDTVRQQGAEGIAQEVQRAVLGSDSSDASDSSDGDASDAGSPMATGPDDADVILASATALGSDGWRRHFLSLETAQDQVQTRLQAGEGLSANSNPDNTASRPDIDHIISATRSYRPRSAPAIAASFPRSGVRSSIVAGDAAADLIPTPPRSPVLSRPVVVFPPSPRSRSRSPSPSRVTTIPLTPPNRIGDDILVSPSPPGSVTPNQPYSWGRRAPTVIGSPTRIRANRDGPLTNPRARMSYARLTTVPSPSLVQRTN